MSNPNTLNIILDIEKLTADPNLQYVSYSPKLFSLISGFSISSLSRDRDNGCLGGIPYRESGGRIVYPKAAVEAWLLEDLKRGEHKHLPNDTPRGRGRPKGTTKAELANRNKQIEPPTNLQTQNKSVSNVSRGYATA